MRFGRALVSALFACLVLAPPSPAATCRNGIQPGGALYRICVPDPWNGDVLVFAHGYVSPLEPVAIPENQLVLPDGTSIPDLVTGLGYAFAATSYRDTGLVIPEAVEDVRELVETVFPAEGLYPTRVLLAGASEGGAVTVLALEEHPDLFSGGLAACGPVGSFQRQLDYVGDFRVLFDYFFPGVLPGTAVEIPEELIARWDDVYVPRVLAAIRANPHATEQLLRVARAPVDPAVPETGAQTVLGVLWYNVFGTNDAREKLGGNPYDNTRRWYSGSDNDWRLNLRIQRFRADPEARRAVAEGYETSGRLRVPLVTLHTTGDPIVPYWHEPLYGLKTLFSGSALWRTHFRVDRYGHCAFTTDEVVQALTALVWRVRIAEWLR
ncbi:prolyl oligopeptidase family serine peptidase [Deferrisoma palaeochoriense]